MFGEAGTRTDGLDLGSHDYHACQAGRWVIWLVPSLLNCCQPGKSGENKSMAPSSRPSMYLSVIKIRNILWWLWGDFSDRKNPSHTGDWHNKWPGSAWERTLFCQDQMLALNGQWQVWRDYCLFTPRRFASFVTGLSIFGNWFLTVYISHHQNTGNHKQKSCSISLAVPLFSYCTESWRASSCVTSVFLTLHWFQGKLYGKRLSLSKTNNTSFNSCVIFSVNKLTLS